MKFIVKLVTVQLLGRPPRGGRGLKYRLVLPVCCKYQVAPLAGGVD